MIRFSKLSSWFQAVGTACALAPYNCQDHECRKLRGPEELVFGTLSPCEAPYNWRVPASPPEFRALKYVKYNFVKCRSPLSCCSAAPEIGFP